MPTEEAPLLTRWHCHSLQARACGGGPGAKKAPLFTASDRPGAAPAPASIVSCRSSPRSGFIEKQRLRGLNLRAQGKPLQVNF